MTDPQLLPVRPGYLGEVSTRGQLCTNALAAGSATIDSGRKIKFIHEDYFTQLKPVFANFSVSTGNVETIISGGSVRCTVENMLTGELTAGVADVNFTSGFAVCTVNFASPQRRGFYGFRFYRQSSNGISYEGYPAHLGSHPLDGWSFSTTSVTDYTAGGTPPQGFLRTQGYGPIMVLAYTRRPSIVLFGTSRTFGIEDFVSDNTGDIGYTKIFGRRMAYTNLAIASSQLQTLLSQSRTARDQIMNGTITGAATGLPYHSHAFMEHAVNDFQGGGRTVAQVVADRTTWGALWAKHIKIGTTITPNVSSTDNFLTTGNQNATGANNVKGMTFNESVRAGITGEDQIIDLADLVDPYRSGKWPVTRNPQDTTAGGASFTAAGSNYTLTVSGSPTGTIVAGAALHGTGVTTGCQILPFGTNGTTGTGGTGTYALSTSQTLSSGTFTTDGLGTPEGLHETNAMLGLMRDRAAGAVAQLQ